MQYDNEKRLQYCTWYTQFILSGVGILDVVFYGEEVRFQLGGFVNSDNNRIWSAENPHNFH
jgi:hypothetical protein